MAMDYGGPSAMVTKMSNTPKQEHNLVAQRELGRQLSRLSFEFACSAKRQKLLQRNRESEWDNLREPVIRLGKQIVKLQKARRWRNKSFNLFDVIDRSSHEHTHSNVLAWLFNPTEAHGLGDKFLRAFLKTIFADDFDLKNDRTVTVKREDKNCDIVIRQGSDWVLVIENKIDSQERKGQTARYARKWRRQCPSAKFAYLSRTGESPKSKDFKCVSFQTVRRVLQQFSGTQESEFLIRHFLENIWFAKGTSNTQESI